MLLDNISNRRGRIIEILKNLPADQLHWIENVITILSCPHKFVLHDKDLMNEEWFLSFGDAVMIHHAFSNEPFTKDKFEHAFVNTAKLVGLQAEFAPRGNRGYDIVIGTIKYSLKTQADRSINPDSIWISKYMELGRGEWNDKPIQLRGLLMTFLEHLNTSDKILILRCLKKAPVWRYELVEIPKNVLEGCRNGNLQMMMNSKQMPKPGYCNVYAEDGSILFQLYFDGGSERKLQIKRLRKSLCNLIGELSFEPVL